LASIPDLCSILERDSPAPHALGCTLGALRPPLNEALACQGWQARHRGTYPDDVMRRVCGSKVALFVAVSPHPAVFGACAPRRGYLAPAHPLI
jgi:hypothetical protein